ncbi:MAG: hypothetical protein LBE09_08465 [Christensenellaceae bacterium]|jgi:acetyl-CoA carboxylase carboxyltransferase component|nr:hypothetical protein [Christensenellaceae bacterium]
MKNLRCINEALSNIKNESGSARDFLAKLIDEHSFVEYDAFLSGKDEIYDSIPAGEGIITGRGTLNAFGVSVAVQNADVLGGSFGKAHSDKLIRSIARTAHQRIPLISVIDSSGMRISEGVPALDAYAKVIKAAIELKKVSTHIAIIKGPATGLMAVFAATADFLFISDMDGATNGRLPSLSLGVPMTISAGAGLNKSANEIVGPSENTQNGVATGTFKTIEELKTTITDILQNMQDEFIDSPDDPNRVSDTLNENISHEELLKALVDNGEYIEFYKSDNTSVKTVLASVNSISVGVVLAGDKDARKLTVADIKKITRFINMLAKTCVTLVNLVDCEGIVSDLTAEKNGILLDVVALFEALTNSPSRKVAVVTGAAIGAAYATLVSKAAGYDYVVAFADATINPMSSAAAVAAFEAGQLNGVSDPVKARATLEAKYKSDNSSSLEAAKYGCVDAVIEPSLLRPFIAGELTAATIW